MLPKVVMPENAVSANLLIRHSEAAPGKIDEQRILSRKGVSLCYDMSNFYKLLITHLAKLLRIGEENIRYICSTLPRTLLTGEKLLGKLCEPNSLLDYIALWELIEDGEWEKRHDKEGIDLITQIQEIIATPNIMEIPEFVQQQKNHFDFLQDSSKKFRLTVALGHEAGLSMVAKSFVNEDDLGLNELDSYLVWLDNNGSPVSIQKIIPIKF